jgi:dCMP deaminase
MEWCRGAHAEQNAIAQAAKNGVSIKGATMYISGQPCSMCTKNIINSGIVEIVILHTDPKPYSDKLADELIKQSGIKVRHVFDSYKKIWDEDWVL